MNREELAWAAGVFSARGGLMFVQAKGRAADRKQLRLSISDKDREIIDRLQALFWDVGRVTRAGQTTSTPRWMWATNRYEIVQAILASIWPWLTDARKATAKRLFAEFHAQKHPFWAQFRHGGLRWHD